MKSLKKWIKGYLSPGTFREKKLFNSFQNLRLILYRITKTLYAMKTILSTLILIASLSTEAVSQDISEKEVPSSILSVFQNKYPNAGETRWEQKDDAYKAEFEVGSREHDLWIDKNGKITKHKEDFPKSELPQAITQKIKTDFKDYKIDDADKIEEGGKVLYEIDLQGKDERKVFFTADGNIQENVVD